MKSPPSGVLVNLWLYGAGMVEQQLGDVGHAMRRLTVVRARACRRVD